MPLELSVRVSSAEALSAAVQTGADSVYLSVSDGSGRDGFSADGLIEAVKFCRVRGIKAYVNFTTICSDSDLLRFKGIVSQININGADGVSAGDLGLIRMIRALAPRLPVFGNELLAVSDLPGAIATKALGLSRIMFARELSLQQMQFILSRVNTEAQVFCHAPQCVSYSGQCYMSSFTASRPANKGQCMHPCRAAYSYFGDIPAEHLSLKDVCLVSHLDELQSVGIKAAVIDMSDAKPEQTALVTSMYSEALKNNKAPTRGEIINLEGLFAREGFNDSYIKGEKGSGMFGMKNPAPDRDAKHSLSAARKLYQGEGEKTFVEVDMAFIAKEGKEPVLYCRDCDGNECRSVSSPTLPSKKSATKEEIRQWLTKTDKTVYSVRSCDIDIDEGLRILPAAVSAMRKSCFDALTARRKQKTLRPEGNWQPGLKRIGCTEEPKLALSFLKTEQITPEILNTNPEIIYLPIWRMHEDMKIIELLCARNIIPCAVLDRVISDKDWPEVLEALRELKAAGLEHVMCSNIGQPALLSSLGFTLRGDFGMNIQNSQSIKEIKAMGMQSCTVSFEMSFAQMKELSYSMDCELIAYGRMPLMLTENCIIHKQRGVHSCHNGNVTLVDKTGRSYPLLSEKGCRNTLYNAEKLWLADKRAEYARLGFKNIRLCFTTENSKECMRVIMAYMGESTGAPERITRGMYLRGN